MGGEKTTRVGDALEFKEGAILARVSLGTYRLSAVKKAAYRLADRCTIIVGEASDGSLPLRLLFAPAVTEAAAMETARSFFRELLDQDLREQIAAETGPLRALILAHAFSKTDLIRHE